MNRIAQPFLRADPCRQSAVERTLTEHVVDQQERWIIRLRVLHREGLARDEQRVRFVRRIDRALPCTCRGERNRDRLERRRALPAAEGVCGDTRDFRLVEITDDRELARRRTVTLCVELANVGDRRRLVLLDLFVRERDVPRVALLILAGLTRERQLAEHHRLAALRLDARDRFALCLLELSRVECRLTEYLADELQCRGQRRTRRLDRRPDIARPGRRDGDLRLQLIE